MLAVLRDLHYSSCECNSTEHVLKIITQNEAWQEIKALVWYK